MKEESKEKMTEQIPKRLGKEPLIEAIWQVQFEPAKDQPLGEILPGVLFTALRAEHPALRLSRLPAAEIPPVVARSDPNLRFAAKYRIEAPEWPFLFQIGDRVVTVNCRRPYVGWNEFKGRILKLIDILESSGLIIEPHRHSLRYIDLITLEPPPSLTFLQMELKMGDHAITAHPLQMRVELPDAGCRHVLQIVTPTQARLPEGEKSGTLIDLETQGELPEKSLSTIRENLEPLHTASKNLFFQQVLTKEAIDRMKPEY